MPHSWLLANGEFVYAKCESRLEGHGLETTIDQFGIKFSSLLAKQQCLGQNATDTQECHTPLATWATACG